MNKAVKCSIVSPEKYFILCGSFLTISKDRAGFGVSSVGQSCQISFKTASFRCTIMSIFALNMYRSYTVCEALSGVSSGGGGGEWAGGGEWGSSAITGALEHPSVVAMANRVSAASCSRIVIHAIFGGGTSGERIRGSFRFLDSFFTCTHRKV